MNIYFWQQSLSPHQADFINNLSNFHKVTLIVEEGLLEWRKKMGWQLKEKDFESTNVIVNPCDADIKHIFEKAEINSIHIFSGFGSNNLISKSFNESIKYRVYRGILAEARDLSGFKGKIRLLKGISERILYEKKIDFILAIGSIGLEYFRKTGFQESKIFPFGYFLSINSFPEKKQKSVNKQFNIIYAGRLTKNKGVKNLLKSIPLNSRAKFEMHFWGEGDLEGLVKNKIQKENRNKIHLHNFVEREVLIKQISKSDLLILPSVKKDGWGVVVNEALMSGTPVIASTQCGSSIMLNHDYLGRVYKNNDLRTLKKIIIERINRGPIKKKEREKIKEWSRRIDTNRAARYLEEILFFVIENKKKPIPPWDDRGEG
ncbi:glycosyltransferase [Planococcus sp. SIMBA_143]